MTAEPGLSPRGIFVWAFGAFPGRLMRLGLCLVAVWACEMALPYLLAIVIYAIAYMVIYVGLLAVAGSDEEDRLVVDAILGKLQRAR